MKLIPGCLRQPFPQSVYQFGRRPAQLEFPPWLVIQAEAAGKLFDLEIKMRYEGKVGAKRLHLGHL